MEQIQYQVNPKEKIYFAIKVVVAIVMYGVLA